MTEIGKSLVLCHILSAFILLYREMRETELGTVGKIMKGVEVMGMGMYIVNMIKCLHVMSVFQYYEFMYWKFPEYQDYFRPGLVKNTIINEWAGTLLEFLEIEVLIFLSFSVTVIILLTRSRT